MAYAGALRASEQMEDGVLVQIICECVPDIPQRIPLVHRIAFSEAEQVNSYGLFT